MGKGGGGGLPGLAFGRSPLLFLFLFFFFFKPVTSRSQPRSWAGVSAVAATGQEVAALSYLVFQPGFLPGPPGSRASANKVRAAGASLFHCGSGDHEHCPNGCLNERNL